MPHFLGELAGLKDTDPALAALTARLAGLGAPENRSLAAAYGLAALKVVEDIILLLHEAIRRAPGRGRAGSLGF